MVIECVNQHKCIYIWVRMSDIGYVGAGGQENKVKMGICWYTGHGFGPYGRGNFPGHDVLGG